MKKYIIKYMLAGLLLASCNESSFLKENPKDFNSTGNSFNTETDFNMSVNNLYNLVRLEYYGVDENSPFDYIYGTDLIYDGEPGTTNRNANMNAAFNATASIPRIHWNNLYKIISEANTILSRLTTADIIDDTKRTLEAKALFFRGMSYRTLAYLYGGVPIILEELETPKTDFA